eukprot:Gb_31598 [translate_table: standard]
MASDRHRLSPLQEFSTYCKINADETDLVQGIGPTLFQTKSSYLHLPRAGVAGSSKLAREKAWSLIPCTSRSWIKVGVGCSIILLLMSIIYLGFGWGRSDWTLESSHFSIILDCGSTGTRVYVYEWLYNSGKGWNNLPVVVHLVPHDSDRSFHQQNSLTYHRVQTEPGLDKLLHNESGLRAAIEPLLHWAAHQVPAQAHKSTPVFLLATAGLRRLPNPDAKRVLDKAWSILETYPFMCQRSWVKIISGVEEAYYGWVALNYNMNRLGSVPKQTTFGALDLGGSSLQVTFESGEEAKNEYGLTLNLGSMEHHLYAYSLPGYGLNDAFEKSLVLLLKRVADSSNRKLSFSRNQLQLKHPCLHAGYRKLYYCSKCNLLPQTGSPQNGGKSTVNETSALELELVGDANWAECQMLAKSTVNASEWLQSAVATNCEQYPCALNKHQPLPYGNFYALSGFFVVYKLFNLSSAVTYDEILEKGRHFCSKTWQDAERSVLPQPFVEQYCFRAPYVVALLRDGLHIKGEQISIGSGSVTWTLGAALLEAGK